MLNIKVGERLAKHLDYDAQQMKRNFYRLTAACGTEYIHGRDAIGGLVVWQYPCEESKNYKARKQRTKPRNHAGSIIRKYNDFVFRGEITRPEKDSLLQILEADADLRGTSLNDFMRSATWQAQIDGVCYILPDTTAPSQLQALTLAQSRELKERPFLRKIKADDVINWVENDGYMLQAVVLMVDVHGDTFAKWYDEENFIDIKLKVVNKWYEVVSYSEPLPHHFLASMPLVALKPTFDTFSQMAPLAESQQKITNDLSLLDQEIGNHCFTKNLLTGIKPGPDDDEESALPKPLAWGSDSLMTTQATAVTLLRLGSDVAQAESLRRGIADETENLYRAAGLRAADPLKVGPAESGISKAFTLNDLSVNLKSLADSAEAAENKIIRLLFKGYGKGREPERVEYEDEFQVADLTNELEELKNLVSSGMSKVTINKQKRFINEKFFSLNEKELSEVEAELNPIDKVLTSSSSTTSTDNVQSTALNGAQVASLLQIAQAVAAKQMPLATAIEIVLLAFPTVNRVFAEQMLNPAASFQPANISVNNS